MSIKNILYIAFISILVSCGGSDDLKARRIITPQLQITTSKQVFNPEAVKIICDSLSFATLNSGSKILKFIVMNGKEVLDTVVLQSKGLAKDTQKDIIIADLDFDGNCEFIIPDKKLTKDGGIKHYYFMFDPETRKYSENKTLPAFINSFKLDIKNQRVKLYCPEGECFAYYKYNSNKKFELVQGEFKSVD